MSNRTVAVLLLSVLLAACGGEARDDRPGQPVAHRRAAFKELLKAFEPMGVMMRDGPYKADKFKQLTAGVMAKREGPWEYFKPDTLYPPSKAKPEVWSDPAGFAAAKKQFFDATEKLAATAAGTPDKDAAKAAFEAVQSACKNCHEHYKTR
ncbi:MAG TPA: cytochrome c [Rhodocyclaceae bacterium]